MAIGGLSVGTAFVDILPNTGKFGPALSSQMGAAQAKSSGAMRFANNAAIGFLAAGAASVKLAADFDESMRNVNSIAQLPERSLQSLEDRVLSLAGKTAQAPKTLADGLYDLVSSGFDADESMKILASSARAATAGLTTTDVSTKAVAAVLNAYRRPASDAAAVSDTLFETVNRGVITFEELATNIGDTLPFASQLGVSLEEVGASTATMTKQGLGASETFTRERNLLQTLIKPSEALSAAYKTLGVENGEALIKSKGFQGALEALVGTTDGSKEAVAKLFPNIRALGGALALTGGNTKAAEQDLKAFSDTTGATQAALREQTKSTAFQYRQFKANLSALAITIGSEVLPHLNDLLQVSTDLLKLDFSKLGKDLRKSSLADSFAEGFDKVEVTQKQQAKRLAQLLTGEARSGVLHRAAGVAGREVGQETAQAMKKTYSAYLDTGRYLIEQATKGIKSRERVAGAASGAVGKAANKALAANDGEFRNTGLKLGIAASEGLRAATGAARREAAALVHSAAQSAAQAAAGGAMQAIGLKLGQQIAEGLRNSIPAIITAGNLASQAAQNAAHPPGKASGGPVYAGRAYMVGERGKELFTPATDGYIVPNHALRTASSAAGTAHGRYAFVIENWKTGEGYFREISASEIGAHRALDTQLERMSSE